MLAEPSSPEQEPQGNQVDAKPRIRVYSLVDGFNFYHALDWFEDESWHPDHTRFRKYKWLSLTQLSRCYVAPKSEELVGVEYFTTYAHWDAGKMFRHKCFVMVQTDEGVKPIFGKFKRKDINCKASCKAKFGIWQEKQTDVNIAVRLVELARLNAFDKVLIVSGDSDLVPAIKLVREIYPEKHIATVVPIGRKGEEIEGAAHSKFAMTEDHLKRSNLPPVVKLKKLGISVQRPVSWV
jgi:uncharacterized LabA/DUF88 family protein